MCCRGLTLSSITTNGTHLLLYEKFFPWVRKMYLGISFGSQGKKKDFFPLNSVKRLLFVMKAVYVF